MPNGGSDCCGTCWFNAINGGLVGYQAIMADREVLRDSYCIIRQLDIEIPMYTYCVNHPHHNPEQLDIPIGPVTINEDRQIWKESPDSEEIRLFLLNYLKTIKEDETIVDYPFGYSIEQAILMHVRDLNEERAIPELQRIINFTIQEPPTKENPFKRNKNATIGLALDTLAKMLKDDLIAVLEEKLESKDSTIRFYAVFSLDYCSGEKSVELLKKAIEDSEKNIRNLATKLLEKKGL